MSFGKILMKNGDISYMLSKELILKVTNDIILDVNKVLEGRAHICGGAIRSCFEGANPRDIDVFMSTESKSAYYAVCYDLYHAFAEYGTTRTIPEEVYGSDNNYYSFDFPYKDTNIIISVVVPKLFNGRECWGDLHKLTSEIDLSVCRFGLKDDSTIYCPDDHRVNVSHIVGKVMMLVCNRPDETLRTQARITKYEGYGYSILRNNIYKKHEKAYKNILKTKKG
jgi:hypothetical protein